MLSESRGGGMSARGGNRLSTGETSDVPNDQFPNFQLSCFKWIGFLSGFEVVLEDLTMNE